jgi:bacteriocin-type transport-associated protein
MTVLLSELSNTDIDWMVGVGERQTVTAGTALVAPGTTPNAVYLLLNGSLSLAIPPAAHGHGAMSTMNDPCGEQEITRLIQGEIVGETPLFNIRPIAVVRAIEESMVLSIPQHQLATKLRHDVSFSAHFYRAIALILSERLRQILEKPGQLNLATNQPVKEALFVFGELWDSDIDWLVAVGYLQKFAAGQTLIQAGRPVDALHIILDGLVSVNKHEMDDNNLLTLCFECMDAKAQSQTVVARVSKGEMGGMSSFLDFRPLPVTLQAVNEALVLTIPRSQLVSKLQQDMGFASRFYRILAIQLTDILQTVMSQMGCSHQSYSEDRGMDDDMEYDDELNMESLQNISHGAARFNWMLKRLGVGS